MELRKLFNIEAGIDSTQDKLPKRLLQEPIDDGPSKGNTHKLDQLLPKYYHARGWSEEGVPTEQKLVELEIK